MSFVTPRVMHNKFMACMKTLLVVFTYKNGLSEKEICKYSIDALIFHVHWKHIERNSFL